MEGKRVAESGAIMVHLASPLDANVAGNVHGGVIMKLIDNAGAMVAHRHSRSNVVTASVDRIDFINPAYVGNVITLKACLNLVGRTSMEVGVRVETENLFTGEIRHAASAFLTYVALDKNGNPAEVAPLILETEEEKQRNREARARREERLRSRARSSQVC